MTGHLTEAELKILRHLDHVKWATPAELGHVIGPGPRKREYKVHLKQQGAGRIGGSIASRLLKRGLVLSASRFRNGHPAYEISSEGRQALVSDRGEGE